MADFPREFHGSSAATDDPRHCQSGNFPLVRMRRLRQHPALRNMIRETALEPRQLIFPLFVRHGSQTRQPISSMPGQFQWTTDLLGAEAREVQSLGLPAVILFGIPEQKDATGSDACARDGIIPRAIRVIKENAPHLLVLTDVCCCEYTDHGHCGVISEQTGHLDVDNDATLELLGQQAVCHAAAGADVIAPSGMMDGMVAAIRRSLDAAGYPHLPILSYAAKYASGFYGPFREAAESAPQFGDRRTYQMDPANGAQALREVALDVAEGADMLMVKPALSYLDIIQRVKQAYPGLPLAAYNVSGEYALVKAAAEKGWIDEQRVTLEILTSIKRAGADMIITYAAKDVARWLAP